MPLQTMIVRNPYTAENHMIPRPEPVNVKSCPDARDLSTAKGAFRLCHVFLRRNLEIGFTAGDEGDGQTGTLRHHCVVCQL